MRASRALLSVAVLMFAACAAPAAPAALPSVPATAVASPAHYPVTVTDDRGKSLTLAGPPRRIVSLAPSATEIVFALGSGDRLIAVDDFSDYPAEAKALPHIGGFRTSPEKVISYTPDLILAITSGNLAVQLETLGQPLFVFNPDDIDGVYRNIIAVGALLDRAAAAEKIVADMRARITSVGEKVKTAATKPRVLHEVDSTNPAQLFVAGPRNFIDSIITITGGINVAADAAVKYPKLSPEEVVARNPDVIILADARFGTTAEMVRARPGWSVITAVRQNAIYPIDDDLVSRPGPRLVEGFEAYLRLIHPELFR